MFATVKVPVPVPKLTLLASWTVLVEVPVPMFQFMALEMVPDVWFIVCIPEDLLNTKVDVAEKERWITPPDCEKLPPMFIVLDEAFVPTLKSSIPADILRLPDTFIVAVPDPAVPDPIIPSVPP